MSCINCGRDTVYVNQDGKEQCSKCGSGQPEKEPETVKLASQTDLPFSTKKVIDLPPGKSDESKTDSKHDEK